jgi:hypothetical protein
MEIMKYMNPHAAICQRLKTEFIWVRFQIAKKLLKKLRIIMIKLMDAITAAMIVTPANDSIFLTKVNCT